MTSTLPKLKRLLLSLTAALLLTSAPAPADDAADIVKQVRDHLGDLKTFSCSFVWERGWVDADRTTRIEGTIVMKRPYLLRVEYPGHVIVVDGASTWTYLVENEQVQISDFVEGGEFPSPETIFRRYAASRKAGLTGVETVNGTECDVLDLIPEDPEDVKVTVWIDRKLHFPLKTTETAPTGNTSTHILGNIALNKPVNDSLFVFQPPEGTSIIDMRE